MLKKLLSWSAIGFSFFLVCPVASAPSIGEEEYPVAILGGGMAGLTSAIYLARAGIIPVVVTGPTLGGAITQSHSIQNWPGELEISGRALAERVKKHAEESGAVLLSESVVEVDFSSHPFLITTRTLGGKERRIKASACIIALGATPRLLGIPGEKEYWSRGVYSCAVCDGGLYRDKVVAVVGGGDSALTEAHYLSNIAKKVYVIVRASQFRSLEKRRVEEILNRPSVEVIFSSEVKEIKGNEKGVTHLLVENHRDQQRKEIAVNGVFLAIGSTPNTSLFEGKLALDTQRYIILKNHQETSIPGVYAVGDIADPEFKQAVSAAGDGSKAALQAQKYLIRYRPRSSPQVENRSISCGENVLQVHTLEELKGLLKQTQRGIILDFYGDYCGPCRTFAPQYEEWAQRFQGKITFAKVNVEHSPQLCETFQIHVIPTLIILDHEGKVIRTSAGFREIAEVGKRLHASQDHPSIDSALFK